MQQFVHFVAFFRWWVFLLINMAFVISEGNFPLTSLFGGKTISDLEQLLPETRLRERARQIVFVPGNSRDGKSREIAKILDLRGKSRDFPEISREFLGFPAFLSLPVSREFFYREIWKHWRQSLCLALTAIE